MARNGKLYVLVCLLLLVALHGFAQPNEFKRDYENKSLPLKQRAKAGQVYAEQLAFNQPDSSILVCNSILKSIEGKHYDKIEADLHYAMGIAEYMLGKFPMSLKNYQLALSVYTKINDTASIAKANAVIAILYYKIEDYEKALYAYQKNLKLYASIRDSENVVNVETNIALTYIELKQFDKALEMNLKAASYYERHNLLGAAGHIYINIALNYEMLGETQLAAENYQKGLKTVLKYSSVYDQMDAYSGYGKFLIQQGQNPKAIELCRKGLQLSEETNSNNFKRDCIECLAKAMSNVGNYKDAFHYQLRLKAIEDSIRQDENARELAYLEYDYEYRQKKVKDSLEFKKKESLKDAEIDKINAERNEQLARSRFRTSVIIGMIVVLVLMIIFGIVLYKRFLQIRKQKLIIEAEKQRSDELLRNILPEKTAEELKLTGSTQPKSYNSVTVVFTDFSGFTKLSSTMSPDQLVAHLNQIFSAFDDILDAHGVEKIKTIGDAYMAVAGLPEENPAHVERAVRAALEMNRYVLKLEEQRRAEGLDYFSMRIGVHTGAVVAGVVGKRKFAYDIWGSTVNIASRMESSGVIGKVNVSETTKALLPNYFAFEHRGKVEAKGIGLVDMYYVDVCE